MWPCKYERLGPFLLVMLRMIFTHLLYQWVLRWKDDHKMRSEVAALRRREEKECKKCGSCLWSDSNCCLAS